MSQATAGAAWAALLSATLGGGALVLAAFSRPESPGWCWSVIGAGYALAAVSCAWSLSRTSDLRPLLRYRSGDPSLGLVAAALLLGAAWIGIVAIEPGAPERAWLFRLLLLARDITSGAATLALSAIVVCEELVWRGWLQGILVKRWGRAWGWAATTAAYTVVQIPTLWLLSDPLAGLNPAVLSAAVLGGAAWGALTLWTQRLWPAVVSHGATTYFAITLLRLAMERGAVAELVMPP